MYVSLPDIVNWQVILPPTENTVGIYKQITSAIRQPANSRLVTLLKFISFAIKFTRIIFHLVCVKSINFTCLSPFIWLGWSDDCNLCISFDIRSFSILYQTMSYVYLSDVISLIVWLSIRKSLFIYECFVVGLSCPWQILGCARIYHWSNTVIFASFVQILVPICWFERTHFSGFLDWNLLTGFPCGTQGINRLAALVPHGYCPPCRQFYPQLEHVYL
jgi:hypothetical protein